MTGANGESENADVSVSMHADVGRSAIAGARASAGLKSTLEHIYSHLIDNDSHMQPKTGIFKQTGLKFQPLLNFADRTRRSLIPCNAVQFERQSLAPAKRSNSKAG